MHAAPIQGDMFPVIVDSHFKWLKVVPVSSPTTMMTTDILRGLFASHELLQQLVYNNGPQFSSMEFSEFMRENGIKHMQCSLYHPSSKLWQS